VAPVPYYLALCAYDEGPWRPIAVRGADEVVGFVMWGVDSTDGGGYWIGGLIIDRRHQRRGYGRAAVLELERAALAGHRGAAS
jgi:diamine N-acetyltransferase